ncbi:MAG: hypothetical protein Q9208_004784 [Pyrenodesmia sp. 3 TL-2023]
MSFLKKMVDKFEDLMGDDDKKKDEKKDEKKSEKDHHEGTKDQSPQSGQQPQAFASQQPSYGAPPASHPNPTGGPPSLPPGWVAQWDPNSQRYYFLEQATGRTQWDPPQHFMGSHGAFPPPSGPLGGPPGGPQGYASHDPHGPSGAYYSQETKHTVLDSHGAKQQEVYEKKEKKTGKGGMLAAGAGGLAVGAVGGAMIGHAMGDDSDDEHHQSYQQQQPTYVQQTTRYQEPAPPGPPPLEAPPPGSDHSSVSSSDKEDLAEAREDYENASDASDREEAREEYEEQYEETYGD